MLIQRSGGSRPWPGPLLLDARALRAVLRPDALLEAVSRSLAELDRGGLAVAPTVHLPGEGGGFHLKSAFASTAPHRAVVKLNGNFPSNPERFGLPTIQGVVALLDGERGRILALMDSIVITALRTAAVSAAAARCLARADSRAITLIGCGAQGREHLGQLARLFPLDEARLFDRDRTAAERLAEFARELGLSAIVAASACEAARGAAIVVTATPATSPILHLEDVAAGAFVAAVGADNPSKSELAPALLAASLVVVDSRDLAAENGDLRAALAAGAMSIRDVHGELPALMAGRIAGRSRPEQRFVFDSTGLAATDLAAANLAYESTLADRGAPRFDFTATDSSTRPPRRTPRRSR